MLTDYSNNFTKLPAKFNSLQFNSCLLMCQVNSQMANYRNSTTKKYQYQTTITGHIWNK